jgi:hypothetical protein
MKNILDLEMDEIMYKKPNIVLKIPAVSGPREAESINLSFRPVSSPDKTPAESLSNR